MLQGLFHPGLLLFPDTRAVPLYSVSCFPEGGRVRSLNFQDKLKCETVSEWTPDLSQIISCESFWQGFPCAFSALITFFSFSEHRGIAVIFSCI